MKIQFINNQNTFQGKVAIITKGLKTQEINMLQRSEKLLTEFAEKQPFDYIISRFAEESLDIAIIDRKKRQKLPKDKEKLSTEVLNYDSTCIKDRDNLNKIFETIRFLTAKWNDKIPYKELSYKEKFIRFFTHFDKEAFRIYRHK